MFPRFLLPALLIFLVYSLALQTSLASAEEDVEKEVGPLMMVRGFEPNPHEKGFPESDREHSRGNNDSDSTGVRRDLNKESIQENTSCDSKSNVGNNSENNKNMMESVTLKTSSDLAQPQEPSIHPLPQGQIDPGNFQGVAIQPAASSNSPCFRYRPDIGFQKKNPETGAWELTDHFNSKKSNEEEAGETNGIWTEVPGMKTQIALRKFINQTKNTRDDNLSKKRLQYEKELDSLHSNSEQAGIISGLIALCNQASEHHYQLINRLIPGGEVSFFDPKEGALDRKEIIKASVLLERLDRINNHPNEVERLIEEIEKDYQGLVRAQETDQEIEARIKAEEQRIALANQENPNQNPPGVISPLLSDARQAIQDSLTHYYELILLKVNSAALIRLPFENNIDEATQAATAASKIDILRKAALAQQGYVKAKVKLCEQTTNSTFDMTIVNETKKERRKYECQLSLLDSAVWNFQQADEEAQAETRQQEVINFCVLSAECYLQVLTSLENRKDPNGIKKAYCFYGLGRSLSVISSEKKRSNLESPNLARIQFALFELEFFETVMASLNKENSFNKFNRTGDPNKLEIIRNLIDLENQMPRPRKQVIDFYNSSASYFKEAFSFFDSAMAERGKNEYKFYSFGSFDQAYLSMSSFFKSKAAFEAACEAEKLTPRDNVISTFIQSIQYFDKMANMIQVSEFYNNVEKDLACKQGLVSFLIALEEQRKHPRKNIINKFSESIQIFDKAIGKVQPVYIKHDGIRVMNQALAAQNAPDEVRDNEAQPPNCIIN